jgi:hypothetical protein
MQCAPLRRLSYLHFSRLVLAEFIYMFFCLDAKEPKNQGCNASLKMSSVYSRVVYFLFVFVIAAQFAKMPELAPAAPTLRTAGIF